MKKFTMLVALILCVTIGGVYATWTYQTGTTERLHQHFNVYMGAVENSEAKGILRTVQPALAIRIDDNEGNNDHIGEAVITGYYEFVFQPSANANDDVRNNGVDLAYILEQTDPAIQFDGANVFTVDGAQVTLGKGEKITPTNVATLSAHNTDLTSYDGCFYYCINASDLSGKITTTVSLPTHDDYVELANTLASGSAKIGISISEVVTP